MHTNRFHNGQETNPFRRIMNERENTARRVFNPLIAEHEDNRARQPQSRYETSDAVDFQRNINIPPPRHENTAVTQRPTNEAPMQPRAYETSIGFGFETAVSSGGQIAQHESVNATNRNATGYYETQTAWGVGESSTRGGGTTEAMVGPAGNLLRNYESAAEGFRSGTTETSMHAMPAHETAVRNIRGIAQETSEVSELPPTMNETTVSDPIAFAEEIYDRYISSYPYGYTPYLKRDISLDRALIMAAEHGTEDEVNRLLDCGADVSAMDTVYRRTALHHAAMKNSMPKVKTLLANGAPLRIKDQGGWTPIDEAIRYGTDIMVRYMFENGADASSVVTDYNENARKHKIGTALHWAVLRDTNLSEVKIATEIAQVLLDVGIDPSCTQQYYGTPLNLAKTRGNRMMSNLLSTHIRSRRKAFWRR